MDAKVINGVPSQVSGAFHDTESKVECISSEEATSKFEIVKSRFFSINNWKEYAGKLTAEFYLLDNSGKEKIEIPEKGDLVKIKIPAPGNPEGEGYDWVKIMEIRTEPERCLMTMQPTFDPQNPDKEIAHFYTDNASSTFIVQHIGKNLFASVHGRNEQPNTQDISLLGKVRNSTVALMGIVGMAKIEWKNLIDGFLNFEENG